mmetsp:Transcript_47909/g.154295  ORF Transcript_47909/g.154295 Transcript_47909/m.154295 type:complete len:275 (-) Transcript_47909:246-1070(-)
MRVLAVHGVLPLLAVLLPAVHGAIATPAVVRSTQMILRRAGSPLLLQRQEEEVTGGLLRRPASFADGKTGVVVPTSSDSSYAQWAKDNPLANNLGIATVKTASADLLAQLVIAQTPVAELDYSRLLLFASFGLVYLGGFQYLYQVQVFKRLFDVDAFTSQPWADKLRDGPGLRALAAQTALDLAVLSLIYLPTFYVFKAAVFSDAATGFEPAGCISSGIEKYQANFGKDEFDLLRVWLPADLVCFSVPLYLRLPVRHVVSFVWTAYLSFARAGH